MAEGCRKERASEGVRLARIGDAEAAGSTRLPDQTERSRIHQLAGGSQLSASSELIEVVRREGHIELDDPVQLASGDWSRHFIDVKKALATGRVCSLAAQSIIDVANEEGIAFDSVGGLTMGADVLAHGVAMLCPDVRWFSVRKKAKDRGTRRRIEGAELGPASRVLLVDDVVTRGGSIFDALEAIRLTGADVVAAITLVDRGPFGAPVFERENVRYFPVMTYLDLGIPPVGSEPGVAETTSSRTSQPVLP